MSSKDFMKPIVSGDSGSFAGGGATGDWVDVPVYSNEGRNYINPTSSTSAGIGRTETSYYSNEGRNSLQSGNEYSHEANNIVANGESTDNEVKLNLAFQPNILDNYDTVTYHWKLFIVDPISASEGDVLNLSNQTIIAESGVSDLTIDKVEIKGITTPSIDGGTGMSTQVKFEVVEPSGAGLIDQIFYQSIALGIGNWTVMPVYIQLQFRGRDPETSESLENGAPGKISSLKWLWALKITRIKANVTTVGTRYEFEAIIYNELAQSNAYFTLQHNIALEKLDTVANAIADLENKLNLDQMLRLIDNYSIPDTFEIIVDPKIANYKITPVNHTTNSVRNNNMEDLDLKDGHFSSGTAVDKIIDTLLSQTAEYQKSMLGAPTPGADGSSMDAEPSQMKKFWRIITETRPLKFDPRRMDDARKFTIYVVQYDIGIMDSNVFQNATPPITAEAERKRLMTYIKKHILKKKYNYIFTGLNDQIINFDLTVNNAFAVAQSRLAGIYDNLAMISKGVVTHDHAKDESAVTEKLSAAISFMSSATTANSTQAKAAAEDARKSIAASDLTPEQKARYTTLLDQSRPENRSAFVSRASAAGGIQNDGTLSTTQFNDRRYDTARSRAIGLATPVVDKVSAQQLTFISDVNIQDPSAMVAFKQFTENAKGKLRPIAHIELAQDKQTGNGIESSSNSGIQKLSSMFSVALHSGLDASFQQIKLTIKGDPFWLFPQPISDDSARPIYNSLKPPLEAIDWIKNAHWNASGDAVNYYGSDNFIIVRFRTPRVFNVDENPTDNDPFTEVATFSGVYKVISVTSKFEVGKFVQELECNLDPEINLLNFTKEIEDNAATKDIPTTVPDLTRKNTFPAQSIKDGARIMGAAQPAPNGEAPQILIAAEQQQDQLGNIIT